MSERAWRRGGRGGRGAQVEQRAGKKPRAGGTNLGNVRPLSSHSSLRRQPLLALLVDALKRAWHALRDTLCAGAENKCGGSGAAWRFQATRERGLEAISGRVLSGGCV